MTEAQRLAKYNEAEKLLTEGLGLVRQRRAELAKRTGQESPEIAELKKQIAEHQESLAVLNGVLQKLADPSKPITPAKVTAGVDDRAGATEMCKVAQRRPHNVFDPEPQSRHASGQTESETLAAMKLAQSNLIAL